MKDLLKDRDGKISSKKVFGAILVLVGLLMGVGLYFAGIFSNILNDPELSKSMVFLFLSSGSGLLGLSVVEHLKPSEKVDIGK